MTKNESNPKSITIVIASKNVHKIREIKSILSSIKQLDILTLLDFPNYTPPEEDKNSFKENAITKAMHAAEKLNHHADMYGFDGISGGGLVAWLMECLYKGYLSPEELGISKKRIILISCGKVST